MKTKKHLPRLAIALIVALALSLTAAGACRSLCIPQLDPRI